VAQSSLRSARRNTALRCLCLEGHLPEAISSKLFLLLLPLRVGLVPSLTLAGRVEADEAKAISNNPMTKGDQALNIGPKLECFWQRCIRYSCRRRVINLFPCSKLLIGGLTCSLATGRMSGISLATYKAGVPSREIWDCTTLICTTRCCATRFREKMDFQRVLQNLDLEACESTVSGLRFCSMLTFATSERLWCLQ
jgi:hypothetical protein